MSTNTEILNRLSSAFSKDPDSNLAKYISIIAAEIDELKAAIATVQAAHQLDLATGIQLDRVVDLLGIARLPGECDDDFRSRAGVLRWLQSSSGTKADLEAIICYMTSYTTDEFTVQENPNAQGNGSGWGRQKWGNSPWGGSYHVGQFRILCLVPPHRSISLSTMYDSIRKAKATGILFLAGKTTILYAEAGIEIGYNSGTTMLPDSYPPGWGRQRWGSSPWGSQGIAISHLDTVVTPIP